MDQATTTALTVIDTEQVGIIISKAPESLLLNKASVDRANSAGQAILDTIEGGGMDDSLDAQCNKYLVKVRKTMEEMNDRRKPITQIMDMIREEFTTLENQISPKNKNSIYARVQALRDKYASDKIKVQRDKEEQAARKLAMDKELIQIKSDILVQLSNYFSGFLSNITSELTRTYNGITLKNFDEVKSQLSQWSDEYSYHHFNSFYPSLRPIYTTHEQVNEIKIEATKGKYQELAAEYKSKIAEIKAGLLDRLPSRKTELQEIERERKLSADRAAEMERQVAERAAAAEAKRKQEEETRLAEEQSRITTTAQAETTQSLFEAQVMIAEAPQVATPVRESYEIEVLNALGYSLIAAFYFEKEGKSEKIEKLEKKTLGAMKKFCESYAMKHGERISSPFLKYNERFKTIAKK